MSPHRRDRELTLHRRDRLASGLTLALLGLGCSTGPSPVAPAASHAAPASVDDLPPIDWPIEATALDGGPGAVGPRLLPPVDDPEVRRAAETLAEAIGADPRVLELWRSLAHDAAETPGFVETLRSVLDTLRDPAPQGAEAAAEPRTDGPAADSPFPAALDQAVGDLLGGERVAAAIGTLAPIILGAERLVSGLPGLFLSPPVLERLEARVGARWCNPRFEEELGRLALDGDAEAVVAAVLDLRGRHRATRSALAALLAEPAVRLVSIQRLIELLESNEFRRAFLELVEAALAAALPEAGRDELAEKARRLLSLPIVEQTLAGWLRDIAELPETRQLFADAADEVLADPALAAAVVSAIRPPVSAPPVDDPEVVVRVGCEVVTRGQVMEEAERRRHEGRSTPDLPSGWLDDGYRVNDPRLSEAADRLVFRVVLHREAARVGVAVTPEEVDRGLAGILQRNGWQLQDLQRFLDGQSSTMEEYRADVADNLLKYKVTASVVHVDLTEEEIHAEYDRMVAAVAPAPVRPYEEARAGLRDRMLEERRTEAVDAYFEQVRRRLEAVSVRVEDGACFEDWPSRPVSEISFEGSSVLDDDELRRLVAVAVGCDGSTWIVPDIPRMATMLRAAFLDLGYVQAEIWDEDAPDGGVVLHIREGETFRIGRIRVLVRAADGTESDPAEDDASWSPPDHPAAGDLFCRREVGELRQALETRFEERWEVDQVATDVDVEPRDDRTVDLTLVVHRP